MLRFIVAGLLASLLSSSTASAQGVGDYLNFETSQVAPITVARVASHDYVLACNTPASTVEVYDTIGMRRVASVRVVLEPCSVSFDARSSRAYVTSMIANSMSVLVFDPSAVGLRVRLDRSVWVGHEPSFASVGAFGRILYTLHDSRSLLTLRDARTLLPIAVNGNPVVVPLADGIPGRAALRRPRRLVLRPEGVYALGFGGGHSAAHDLDLWYLDFASVSIRTLGGLGTTKTAMAFAANGDLFVAASDAQNQRVGERVVAAAPTGFVRSLVHRVRGVSSGKPKLATRDLNVDSVGRPVGKATSLSHPTDLVVYERPGKAVKLFVCTFHSDRLAVIDASAADAAKWTIRTVDMTKAPGSTHPLAGPRGLALKRAIPGLAGDPGDRLYVLNRFDASIAVVDPGTERILSVLPLAIDPTPAHVDRGRRFLYDAKLSGSGFVACASCHVDGRSDGLAWDLSGSPSDPRTPFRTDLVDGVTAADLSKRPSYAPNKGPLVTQTFQGLVDYEVEGPAQAFLTNEPFHWRGDRSGLAGFNAAFVGLMGAKNIAAAGKPPRALSDAEMAAFVRFSATITFPPNPDQPFERRHSGRLGDPKLEDGWGALLGQKLFHTRRLVDLMTGRPEPRGAGRSCVQCHALPSGTNNRITALGLSTTIPVETPGMRGLALREGVLVPALTGLPNAVTVNEAGLEHRGTFGSIEDFNNRVFGHHFQAAETSKLDAISLYLREFDTGVAPLVGVPWTVEAATRTSLATLAVLDGFEAQASDAQVGLVARASLGGTARGFWFDPVEGRYTEVPGATRLARSALLALLRGTADRLVFEAVPLGSERRLASPTGRSTPLAGPAPTGILLLPMRVNRPWEHVPLLTKNWKLGPVSDVQAFAWNGVFAGTSRAVPEPSSLRALRLLQQGLLLDATKPELAGLRHEPPRRFVVAGRNIRHGARLLLLVPNDSGKAPPYTTLRPVLPLELPVYATGRRTASGLPIFESAVEVDARVAYVMRLGGPAAPGVLAALQNRLAEPPPKGSFDPDRWNRHLVVLRNADGSFGSGGWQALRL